MDICAKQCAVCCLLHHSKTSPQHTEVINEIKICIFIREVSCIPTEREREREEKKLRCRHIYQLQSSVTQLFAAIETKEISAVAWYSGRVIRRSRW